MTSGNGNTDCVPAHLYSWPRKRCVLVAIITRDRLWKCLYIHLSSFSQHDRHGLVCRPSIATLTSRNHSREGRSSHRPCFRRQRRPRITQLRIFFTLIL